MTWLPPKAPPPKTITAGLALQHMNWGWEGSFSSIARWWQTLPGTWMKQGLILKKKKWTWLGSEYKRHYNLSLHFTWNNPFFYSWVSGNNVFSMRLNEYWCRSSFERYFRGVEGQTVKQYLEDYSNSQYVR